eukprot:CAMPEP_0118869522 /NCGR_PEP_ID=MMETSP1163-20130328/12834_1 /TAXON_ID=124430 /ORGANISM="Phaeomonas parva, Strain CCMP2877" /LENGTH=282 /DNA_ID=CAMNT_0006804425 /DNA_START=1 /DNA_END=849 /DNA_ORIENTATION=-
MLHEVEDRICVLRFEDGAVKAAYVQGPLVSQSAGLVCRAMQTAADVVGRPNADDVFDMADEPYAKVMLQSWQVLAVPVVQGKFVLRLLSREVSLEQSQIVKALGSVVAATIKVYQLTESARGTEATNKELALENARVTREMREVRGDAKRSLRHLEEKVKALQDRVKAKVREEREKAAEDVGKAKAAAVRYKRDYEKEKHHRKMAELARASAEKKRRELTKALAVTGRTALENDDQNVQTTKRIAQLEGKLVTGERRQRALEEEVMRYRTFQSLSGPGSRLI